MFDVDQFIDDLRGSLVERSRSGMREIVARAVSDPGSVLSRIGEPNTARIQVLHRAPDLTVLDVVWAPHQITQPHDHHMAAIIGIYGGREDNMFWRRRPDARKFQIEVAGGQAVGTGDAMLLGRDIIHSVINPRAKLSGAIHVYDGDFFATPRSMWDVENLVEQPYDLSVAAGAMLTRGAAGG